MSRRARPRRANGRLSGPPAASGGGGGEVGVFYLVSCFFSEVGASPSEQVGRSESTARTRTKNRSSHVLAAVVRRRARGDPLRRRAGRFPVSVAGTSSGTTGSRSTAALARASRRSDTARRASDLLAARFRGRRSSGVIALTQRPARALAPESDLFNDAFVSKCAMR